MKRRISIPLATALILALLATPAPTANADAALASMDAKSLTCRRVNQGNGCECYIRNSKRTPLGWRSRPMLYCRLAGV